MFCFLVSLLFWVSATFYQIYTAVRDSPHTYWLEDLF